jgi:phospholipid/cholesterol/gamma-HCH transport system permease protein
MFAMPDPIATQSSAKTTSVNGSSVSSPAQTQSAQKGTVDVARKGGAVTVAFGGTWRIGASLDGADRAIGQAFAEGKVESVTLCVDKLDDWDSLLLVAIHKIEAECAKRKITVDREGLPESIRKLLALAEVRAEGGDPQHKVAPSSLVLRIGIATQKALSACETFNAFLGEATIAFGRFLVGRARFRRSDFFLVIQQAGAQALPIVSLISVMIGLILAFVGAIQLRQFGVELYVANLVSIASLREMGAIMTAIIMAGRTGAAFAAELGTMQVNEEIDALKTLGFDPMEFLVLPRMLALVLMMPLLCLYADALAILGGSIIGVGFLNLPWIEYWHQTQISMTLNNFLIGIAKSCVFGVIVALSGCLKGMNSGRSAASVGLATTSAVVTAIVLIVALDGIFAVILDLLGL